MSIFRSYVFNNNNEIIYCHKMLNLSNNQKFKFLSQFNLYVLKKSFNFASEKKARVNKSINKINKFEYFRRNFVIFKSTFLINVKVCLFLKHDICKRFLFIDTAVAHNIFYKIFYRLFIVRCNFRISFLIFILSR